MSTSGLDPDIVIGLCALAAIVCAPFLLRLIDHILSFRQRKTDLMAVSAAAQALVDELNTAAGALSTALANADANATAQSAEDLAAIKAAADALVSAINTAATPPSPPPTE